MKLPDEVRVLFTPPFSVDDKYVRDASDLMASSHRWDVAEPMGELRHYRLEGGESAHRKWVTWFVNSVPFKSSPYEATRILNDAWAQTRGGDGP